MYKRKQRSSSSPFSKMEPFQSPYQIAQKTWELENNIIPIAPSDPSSDAILYYGEAAQAMLWQDKPWSNDPHYFKRVKISALALLKMVAHARSGGTAEVMGIMHGMAHGDTIIVMDAFPFVFEGTEIMIDAQTDAYEYTVDYTQTDEQAGIWETAVGWYHSHTGYGCCLSGTDVSTQRLNQEFQDPYFAVVIDPTRTISAGKVEIGAFRTYPEGYKPPDNPASDNQAIPLEMIADFGAHCNQYYSLDITYFKSSLDCHLLDQLWNKYWADILSSSPFLRNEDYVAGQISVLADKLAKVEKRLSHKAIGPSVVFKSTKVEEATIRSDSAKISVKNIHGLMSQVIKDVIFNSVHRSGGSSGEPSRPENQ